LTPFLNFTCSTIRSHAISIHTLRFHKIAYIDFYWSNLFFISYFKIEPICMSSCIGITANKTIILIIFYFYCQIQITTFKSRIKDMLVLYNYWVLLFIRSNIVYCLFYYIYINTVSWSILPKIVIFLINLNRIV
jgi:hypothetical protein